MPLTFPHKPGLVVFVTCGDPDMATTQKVVMAAIAAGADVIELGVPFSDPVADGPVIQRASERALRGGANLEKVLQLAAEIRRHASAGLMIFSYMNPILQFGLKRFCVRAAKAGLDGALVVDLTLEESGGYIKEMRARRLNTVFLAAPTSSPDRLQRIASASSGFIYAVSRTGVTGMQKELQGEAHALVDRLRPFTDLPIAVGFGISTAAQLREVGRFADAGVVGSAIVRAVEQCPNGKGAGEAVGNLVRSLVGRADRTAS